MFIVSCITLCEYRNVGIRYLKNPIGQCWGREAVDAKLFCRDDRQRRRRNNQEICSRTANGVGWQGRSCEAVGSILKTRSLATEIFIWNCEC